MADRVDQLREKFHNNWRTESDICGNCDLCANARPQGGAINFDANVALVNNTPGLGDSEKSGENRERLNLEEKESPPESVYSNYNVPREVEYPYTYKILNEWDTLSNIKRALFDDPLLDLDLEDVYYTNSLKCPKTNILIEEMSARKNCSEYLREELLEAVDVDIIITGGAAATKSVFYALDMRIPIPSPFTQLIDSPESHGGDSTLKHGAYGQNPVVIPTYQFGNLFRNWYHPNWVDGKESGGQKSDYYQELIKRINYHHS